MSNVSVTKTPEKSQLYDRLESKDFLDCYSVASDLSPRRAADVITDFPQWAKSLLRLRNVITAPFGLSPDGPDAADKVGLFPVESENEYEVIAGFNDKHLDFRVSVISDSGRVFLSTWVHPHNIGGRIYLRSIMPFHILIVRNALKRVSAKKSFV